MLFVHSTQTKMAASVRKIPYFRFFKDFRFPERLKGGKIEKLNIYLQTLYSDYKAVAIDTYNDCKDRPIKASLIFAGLGFGYYALRTNPTEQTYRDRLLLSANRLLLTTPSIQNPKTCEYLNNVSRSYNEGLIRYFSFGIFSIIWVDNYDHNCDVFAAQCSYLKPEYLKFYTRIIDFGFLEQWRVMKSKMIDYDVNPDEWKNEKIEENKLISIISDARSRIGQYL